MLEFIYLLKQRYSTVLSHCNEANKTLYLQRIEQLVLAEAFLRKGQLINSSTKTPLQIAVIGPTQAGKSTLVNILLNNPVAGVSPLAGFTVHAQGFCHNIELADCAGLQAYFGRYQCVPQSQLSRERFDCYALIESHTDSNLLVPCVLWDTPDFDSIDSATYREGVLRAISLADIIILLVSKEKYADQSVWEMMAMLELLHQPTLICLNKLEMSTQDVLIASLKEKWQSARTDKFPEVVPLYYEKLTAMPLWQASQQHSIKDLFNKVSTGTHARFERELLQHYWQAWLQPVMAEHQAQTDWQNLVHELIGQALDNYQRDYQNHPHYYETFSQALAELLILLEVPGLAGVMAGARRTLTWPVRQIMKLGQKRLHITDSSHEIVLLKQLAEHTLIQLADRVLDKTEQNSQTQWWKELAGILRTEKLAIVKDFTLASKEYHRVFQAEVENAAQRLYSKLQQQPVVLNSLRATRVTTDALIIALTLYTGGIGVQDLIIAPAMLTISSLLAESAIGSYMYKVQAELKQQQLTTVKEDLFFACLAKKLLVLPESLSALTHFNITREQLDAAQLQLGEKPHGLRLL